jgi:hypothetical protein
MAGVGVTIWNNLLPPVSKSCGRVFMMRIGIHKLMPRGVGILTFGIGLLVSLIVSNLISPPKNDSHVVAILMPTREWSPMLNPDEQPFASNNFLFVQQQSAKSPIDRLPDF